MEVLIVAKTHLSDGFCIGGLVRHAYENIRLLEPTGFNQPLDTAYEVGHVWDLDFVRRSRVTRPHIEDVFVDGRAYLRTVRNIKEILLNRVNIWSGGPERLFDGLINLTQNGIGYISAETGIPAQSVGFWLTNEPLIRYESYGKTRYHTIDERMNIPYVGVGEAIDLIPAETLLRVSLCRWWKKRPGIEKRCYLQLSGWFL